MDVLRPSSSDLTTWPFQRGIKSLLKWTAGLIVVGTLPSVDHSHDEVGKKRSLALGDFNRDGDHLLLQVMIKKHLLFVVRLLLQRHSCTLGFSTSLSRN